MVNCTLLPRRSMVVVQPWLSRELANGRPEQVGRRRASGSMARDRARVGLIWQGVNEDENHVPGPRRA